MPLVALAAWLLAALVGIYLLFSWLKGGGLRQQATKVTRFPITLIFSHPVLAVAGLGLWGGFLITGAHWLAWLAFVAVTVVALLGFTMFTRWLGDGRHARGAERRFPALAVLLHGAAGVSAFVLVLLTATRVTR
ncbi:hypothetical protein Acor_04450 [Acrocarpospora corrugata]|uniref:DUF2269 domain-containing protein n=1 Tax=Acrocarpospora corrugata TaxID=35763 RepID=A0A5M3VPI8_9ACTN|nr:hypothetical protein [Acrocarpospora corrugata]GER98383.1 hypothetical protein Acor_04450 [Acrocarpospora corrugata]